MPSARQKERRKKLLSGPRIWQREFIPPSASYPIRSRRGPHYRPAPPFNKYYAKENRHERIDLYPLRRLLHPRSETIGATGAPPIGKYGRMRQRYLKEHRPGLYSSLILSEKLYPHLLEIDRRRGSGWTPCCPV